jgi:hypothetical protein
VPTIVFNYPKAIKSFYMKANEDGKTVQAMDILVPGVGELVGGSVREDDISRLDAAITANGLNPESYWWCVVCVVAVVVAAAGAAAAAALPACLPACSPACCSGVANHDAIHSSPTNEWYHVQCKPPTQQ